MIQWWWLIPTFIVAFVIGVNVPEVLFLLEYFRDKQ